MERVKNKSEILKFIKIYEEWKNPVSGKCKICKCPDEVVDGMCCGCYMDEIIKRFKGHLKNAIYVLKRIRGLDKTAYTYYDETSRSPEGVYPKRGTRWKTPSEMAVDLLRELGVKDV